MKKILLSLLFFIFTCASAWALDYTAVVTNVSVSQLNSITKNQFTVTITQDGRNSGGSWFRNSTATLILESNDRTLEGTYKSTNSANSNKINANSQAAYGSNTGRMLRSDQESKLTINKTAEGSYAISSSNGWLGFEKNSSTYNYTYCYYFTNVAKTEYALGNFGFSYTPESYCAAPTGLSRSDLTFSWTSSASTFQYCCLPSSTTLSTLTDETWIANRHTISTNSVTLDGLVPGASYKFFLLAEGPGGTSKIVASSAFTVPCVTIAHSALPWEEGFEGMSTSTAPNCWTELKNGTATVRPFSGSAAAGTTKTGTRSMRIYGGSTNSEVIAVFPEFADAINSLGLSFWYKSSVSTAENNYGNIQLGYISDPTDAETFVAVGDPLEQSADFIQVQDFVMPEASSGDHFAIKYCNGSKYGYAYIDDITVDVKPTSVCPTSMTVSNITSDGATLSWNENGMSSWRLQYSTDGEIWIEAVAVNTNSYTLSGLNDNTLYYVRVKGYNGEESAASIVRTFRTLCSGITSLPWTHNFDEDESNSIPDCWAKIGYYCATGFVGEMPYVNGTASYAHGGSGKSLFSYGGGSTSTTIIILPPFEEETANLAVSFWYNNRYTDNAYGRTELGYITDINDPTTFTYLERFEKVAEYTYVNPFPMTGAPAGSRIAIRHQGGSSDAGYSDIDDITVDLIPECDAPSALSVSDITTSGATISWTAENEETAWKMQYSTDGTNWTDVNEGNVINSNPYTLTGLSSSNTLYYVRVKAVCGGLAGESGWSGPVSFRTDCDAISVNATTSWNENFDEMAENIVPECWNNSASTGIPSLDQSYYIWGTYAPSAGNNMLRMNNATVDGGTALINTPSFTIPNDGKDYELTFDYANRATSGNLLIKLSIDGGAFNQIGSYNNPAGTSSAYPGELTTATIPLTGSNGHTIRIQFYTEPSAGYTSTGVMFIDNVSVHKVPTCFPPTNIEASDLTSASAHISWTAGASETAWRLQYRAEGGEWSAEQAISTTPEFDITGLSANTIYEVRIKGYCAIDDQSEWSETASFTTPCAAASMPFEEHFSAEFVLPSCWEATPATGTYRWYAHSPSYGQFDAMLRTGLSGSAELRMPPVSLSEAAILQFEWRNENGAQVDLYISTDGGSSRTLIPTNLGNAHASWTTKIIDLAEYTGETVLIYFVGTFSTANQYAYLDDVEIIARPCHYITNIQAAPITNGATLSWSGNVKKIRYKKGSDAWSYATIASADYAEPHTLSGLTGYTGYQACLLPACSEEEEANWTAPISFLTKTTQAVPYSNDFESETAGALPINWSKQSTSEYPQVAHNGHAYGIDFGDEANSLMFAGNNEQIAILPEFTEDLDKLLIQFYYRSRHCSMELGYVEADGVTYVTIEALPSLGVGNTSYGELPYEKELSGISSDAKYLAIRYYNATNIDAQAFVDNLLVDIAECGKPNALSVNAITANTAHVSWAISDGGYETQYQYICRQWSESDPNWASATLLGEGVREVNLTGLTANKDYEFYLRSYCGASKQSTPIKIEFTTECNSISALPWTADFESTDAGKMPQCWQKHEGADGNVYVYNGYGHTAIKSLRMGPGTSASAQTAVLPKLTASLSGLHMTFWYYGSKDDNTHTYGKIQVGYMTEGGDASTFVAVGEPIAPSNSHQEADVFFTNVSANAHIAIRYCGGTNEGTLYIDDIQVSKGIIFEDLASATDNESRLEAVMDQTLDVTIKRPLLRNGDYCTLALPFDLSAAQIADENCPLHGFTIKEFERSESGTEVNIYLTEVSEIVAGKPYFVRYAGTPTNERLTPLNFRNVTVAAYQPSTEKVSDDCSPYAIFNPYPLIANDQSTLFLSSNNTLYYPSANGTMNGFRAYIKVGSGSSLGAPIRNGAIIRIVEKESTATGIGEVRSETTDVVRSEKILRDGQIIIIRGDKEYNVMGNQIR